MERGGLREKHPCSRRGGRPGRETGPELNSLSSRWKAACDVGAWIGGPYRELGPDTVSGRPDF